MRWQVDPPHRRFGGVQQWYWTVVPLDGRDHPQQAALNARSGLTGRACPSKQSRKHPRSDPQPCENSMAFRWEPATWLSVFT